jgi:hypothetical protein
MSFTSANADEKRRHFTDVSSNVFESDDSNNETSFTDASFRKKHRKLFEKKKKKRNFITRKQKKQTKNTRRLNEKAENHEHALLKR